MEAAPLTDAGLTPYRAVKRSLPILLPGSSAVVIGAGGLGHMAIQILQHLTPAQVIVVDKNPVALELAREKGADVTSSPVTPRPTRSARRPRAGRGGRDRPRRGRGHPQLAASVARPLGHVTLVGIAGGTYPFGFFTAAYEVAFASSNWGTIPELVEMIAMAEAGHLHVHVQRLALDEAIDGYRQLAEGKLLGRGVVVP